MLIVKKNQNAIPNKRIYCDATSVTNLLTGLPPTLGVALALDIHQKKYEESNINLFYLDQDLDKCAEYHVDRHVNKMILEAAQLINTNLWIDDLFGFVPRAITKEENKVLQETRKKWKDVPMEDRLFPYLPTMQNHPSCIWVRSSLENFYWTNCYAFALASEAHYRYGSLHKSFEMLCNLPEPKNMEDHGFTQFALAMTEELKDDSNPIQSYRNFYMLDKATFAEWKHRDVPPWWDHELADYEQRISRR